jgi:hypothetical protein
VGLFKPVSVDRPVELALARDVADDSLWWRHEALHRRVARNPAQLRPVFIRQRDEVQANWIASPPESAAAFAEADALLEKWTELVSDSHAADVRPPWVRMYWDKRNRWAGLELASVPAAAG